MHLEVTADSELGLQSIRIKNVKKDAVVGDQGRAQTKSFLSQEGYVLMAVKWLTISCLACSGEYSCIGCHVSSHSPSSLTLVVEMIFSRQQYSTCKAACHAQSPIASFSEAGSNNCRHANMRQSWDLTIT